MLIKKVRIPVKQIVLVGLMPSFLKKFVYRLKGYKIARGVKFGFGCVVIGKEVSIGEKTSIGMFTIVRANKIDLGRFVKIGAMSAIDTEQFSMDDDARINEQVYIGGIKKPESRLAMGKRTIIMQGSYINPTEPIVIGDDSGIGGHCLLFTHGSWNSQLEGYPVKFAPITIGKKVWLPWRVFVMPGVSIGDGAVIGADSTVTKDVPPHSLAAGSPAQVIKQNIASTPTEDEKTKMLESILSDFCAHLQHHGFALQKSSLNDTWKFTFTKGSTIACVDYSPQTTPHEKPASTNSVLMLRNGSVKAANGYGMVISLSDNTRIGSSNAGEELVQFLSRYGVRFNRLD